MSTESHLKGENVWAGIKGASASTVAILIVLLIAFFVIPSTPENDGAFRALAILIGLMPLAWGVLFFYYLILGIKKNRPFKFALIVQTGIIIPFSILVFYKVYFGSNFVYAFVNSVYIFGTLTIIGVVGAWAWSKPKNT